MPPAAPTRLTAAVLREVFGTRPFTRHEARACGVTPDRLRQAVVAGVISRVHRGWYAVPDDTLDIAASTGIPAGLPGRPAHHGDPLHEGISAAALAIFRDLDTRGAQPVLAGSLAAACWGLDTLGDHSGSPGSPAVILVAPGGGIRRGQRGPVLVRESLIDDSDIVRTADGLAITGALRTGLDCARGRDPVSAFIVTNSAVRRSLDPTPPRGDRVRLDSRRLTDRASDPSTAHAAVQAMRSAVERCDGRGLAVVARVIESIDPRLETALESLSWWRFHEWGLALPVPQQWVRGASGRRYRVDFDFGDRLGEADGLSKYAGPADLRAEKSRHMDLELGGRPLIRWGWVQMWRQPATVLHALTAARP